MRRNATSATATVFGSTAGLAGLEHALGEILQGNVASPGLVFLSWPDSRFFRVVGGEPAMSLIPNLLASGLASALVSAAIVLWSLRLSPRKGSGYALILLSILLLLVGGGFGPPALGIIVGTACLKNRSRFAWARNHISPAALGSLSAAWPYALGLSLAAWLALLPGTMLLDLALGLEEESALVYALILTAFSTLALAILAALGRDAHQAARQ